MNHRDHNPNSWDSGCEACLEEARGGDISFTFNRQVPTFEQAVKVIANRIRAEVKGHDGEFVRTEEFIAWYLNEQLPELVREALDDPWEAARMVAKRTNG